MRKIRLLHILPSLEHGGTEQLLYDILSRISKKTFKIWVCCTQEVGSPEWHRRFQAAGMHTDVLPYKDNRLYRVLAMFRYLRRKQFDIVHIHNYEAEVIYSRLAAILARVPIIMTYDHDIHPDKRISQIMWRVLNPFNYSNVVISEARAALRKRSCGGQPWKVVTILNGVDLDFFRPHSFEESVQVKTRLGIGPSARVVGAIGRFIDWKRFDLFLCSASLLRGRRDVEFILRGEGLLKKELKQLAEKLGLGDQMHFIRRVPDMRDVYRTLDALVVTSGSQEGFGLVTAEAMASGVPVVAVNSPTHMEVVGDAGLIVEPKPEKIAEAIAQILDDKELAEALAKKGRKRVEEQFNIDRTTSELHALYLRAMEGN